MIKAYFPYEKSFPYTDSKDLYENKQEEIGDDQSFDDVINSTMYIAFTENDKLLGGIYFYNKDSKIFVNAFANRKTYNSNVNCIKWALNGFEEPVYAKTIHRHVKILLLKLGFEKVEENLYKYERTK